MVVVDPDTLPARLTAAGLTDIEVATAPGQLSFVGRAPA
jgi:hypothetical protein